MELLLNLLWLAIALTAFARVAAWSRGERDRRRVVAAVVATACVVAILFPIISITDDLTTSVASVNETAAVQLVMAAAAQIIVAVALTLVAFVVEEESFVLPSAPALTSHALRGPPLAGR
jgi:Na+/melibiose symporter-like transporter